MYGAGGRAPGGPIAPPAGAYMVLPAGPGIIIIIPPIPPPSEGGGGGVVCGVGWCGVVWCGVVWCGVVWWGGVVVSIRERHTRWI